MKSFKIYLNEADYSRFLKKNKNLTKDQVELINKFFKSDKEAVKKYEKKFGWQSKHPQKMVWADFENIMSLYKSGRRINLKNIKVQGKKGTDYWSIRLKTKSFIANIPLNWKTAKYMNSCKYGTLEVRYCIGWDDDKSYWNDHVLNNLLVPVYIVDGYSKWVVMIEEGNRSYEVWDKWNQKDIAKSDNEPIPNFSIYKELLGSRMGKLYDDIREEFYANDDDKPPYTKKDYEDALFEFEQLLDDIETDIRAEIEAESNYNYFRDEMKNKTVGYYEEAIEDLEYKLSLEKKQKHPDQVLISIHVDDRRAYADFIEDLDDMWDKEDFERLVKKYEEKYPDLDFEMQGEMYDYETINYAFENISNYDDLLNVLIKQGTEIGNHKKITEDIKQKMSELAWDISTGGTYFERNDIYDILEPYNLDSPEYREEYYN